jgi:UDP-3-O-[3-hydroxymyristoyl] glucosamine N-acyltransferase
MSKLAKHSVIVAQVGIAGSTKTGRYLVVAGQAGIGGHLTLGDGVTIGPQCGVAQSIPDNRTVSGTTLAMPHGIWLRLQKVISDLPDLFKRVRRLERQQSARSPEVEKQETERR